MQKSNKKHPSKKKRHTGGGGGGAEDRVVIDLDAEPLVEDSQHPALSFGPWPTASNAEIDTSGWIFGKDAEEAQLKVCSFNVLADAYTFPHFYKHLAKPGPTLSWSKRSKMIISILMALDADILCLQEVDHFDEVAALLGVSYDGVYACRTGHKADGLATFWKREKLAQLGEKAVLSFDEKMGKNGESRVALRVCLNFLASKRLLQVVQTHLDYKRPHAQVEMCQLLSAFVKEGMREVRDACIVCGDFNSELNSAAVSTLTGSLGRFRHCTPVTGPFGHPVFSSVIKEPKLIDHVLYDGKFLKLCGIVTPLLSSAKLPNNVFPSDHFPVGGAFQFVEKE